MSDFPGAAQPSNRGLLSSFSLDSYGSFYVATRNAIAAAVWPTANLGLFIPVVNWEWATAYEMIFTVGTQSGNVKVGLYDEKANQLTVSASTAVAAAGEQVIDITDTALSPGLYFLFMVCDNITAAFSRGASPTAAALRPSGLSQQATVFTTPPAVATLAAPGQAFVPYLAASLKAGI